MPNTKHIIFALTVAALAMVAFAFHVNSDVAPAQVAIAGADKPALLPLSANALTALGQANPFGLVPPVEQFKEHITKKTFGMYITPDTSPVEGDRFTGYHTGVDAEFTDTTADIPVVAITDGTIVMAKWMKGYGGLIVIRHTINDMPVYALYGHLNVASFPPVGTTIVARGDRIAVLGDDHSHETDGVRKHLHFAIYTGEKIDYRGYVRTQTELSGWIDPLRFF